MIFLLLVLIKYMVIKGSTMKIFMLTEHGMDKLQEWGFIVHLHDHGGP